MALRVESVQSAVDGESLALVAAFASKVQALGVPVEHVPDSESASRIVVEVVRGLGVSSLMSSAELADSAPLLIETISKAGPHVSIPNTIEDTRDAPLGMSYAKLAVAETGSAMLAEDTLLDRAVGMLSKSHIIIVKTETLVPSLVEAAAALRELALRPGGGYAALVTGPSRTADIELSLSLGVQGPERVFVIFVDNLT